MAKPTSVRKGGRAPPGARAGVITRTLPSPTRPDRFEQLLTASLAIHAAVDLPSVLQHIVDTARAIIGARYAAIGVLSADGGSLAEFVTSGLNAKEIARIGERPTGQGLLGLLIRDSKVLRVADISKHSWHAALPSNHPPMRSFLGIPILSRGTVFGNLYVTEKLGTSSFTPEDERIGMALAVHAGGAIANARLLTELRAARLAQDRFHAVMNHELRNALTGVYGWLDLLLRRGTATVPPAVAEASSAASHAVQLLDDMLDLARTEAGALKVRVRVVIPDAVLSEAVNAVAPLAQAARVRIAWDQDQKCDTPASTDGLRIRQVLINTLRNAVQHSPAGETVRVVVGDDGTTLAFAVTDHGPGIDVGQQELLFEAFTRDTEEYVGTGLGLTLSRRLARLLGGDLTVQSELGQGATFTLRVPRSLQSPG